MTMLDGRSDSNQGTSFMADQNGSQDNSYMRDQASGDQQLPGSSAASPSSDLDDEIPF
jgi:single-stranded DNA-binding protein